MGLGNSKGNSRRSSSFGYNSGSGPSSWADRYPEARPYPAPSYPYPAAQSNPSSSAGSAPNPSYSYEAQSSYSSEAPSGSYAPQRKGSNDKLQRRYSRIADNYNSLDQVHLN